MQDIVEPRSATARTRSVAFRDEFGVYQFREVLADRVVIQAEMRSELRDIDGPTCIGDVPKDLVAGRVTQSSRLFLQSGRHPLNELPFRIVNFYCSLEMEFARATQQAESRQALEAGAMETMLQAIERFRGHGYELDLSAVEGGWLRCSGCGDA